MGTKREELESTTGCLAKAADDEPIFILRAHDTLAPEVVREWARRVEVLYWGQITSQELRAKLDEARTLANRMEQWQEAHGCKVPD